MRLRLRGGGAPSGWFPVGVPPTPQTQTARRRVADAGSTEVPAETVEGDIMNVYRVAAKR